MLKCHKQPTARMRGKNRIVNLTPATQQHSNTTMNDDTTPPLAAFTMNRQEYQHDTSGRITAEDERMLESPHSSPCKPVSWSEATTHGSNYNTMESTWRMLQKSHWWIQWDSIPMLSECINPLLDRKQSCRWFIRWKPADWATVLFCLSNPVWQYALPCRAQFSLVIVIPLFLSIIIAACSISDRKGTTPPKWFC
jgi:hypothetical protein